MTVIASGGNYAFLNHLTAVPMLISLDDKFLLHMLPPSLLPPAPRACRCITRFTTALHY